MNPSRSNSSGFRKAPGRNTSSVSDRAWLCANFKCVFMGASIGRPPPAAAAVRRIQARFKKKALKKSSQNVTNFALIVSQKQVRQVAKKLLDELFLLAPPGCPALRVRAPTPYRGQHQRPGEAGSAVFHQRAWLRRPKPSALGVFYGCAQRACWWAVGEPASPGRRLRPRKGVGARHEVRATWGRAQPALVDLQLRDVADRNQLAQLEAQDPVLELGLAGGDVDVLRQLVGGLEL